MSILVPGQNLKFLGGGGEMGARTRSNNWAQSPVGLIEDWPQSLRTTLSIVLNSRFPMFLFWGPELICFYNDAYRPSLGLHGKHPRILGQKAEDAWPEIWDIIKPFIDEVLSGGEATWSEDQLIPIYRNGKLEDVYWTFSYSPVYDESNLIAGVLVTCSETTARVHTLKILEESNRRYYDHIMHAPVAMSIFKGKDYLVDIANQQMLTLLGKNAEQVINRPLFQSFPEVSGQGLKQLFDQVYSTGKNIVENERMMMLIREGKLETLYVDFVLEPIKNSDKTVQSIIVTASDVTNQVLARKKVEESEKRFRNTVAQAPLGITILQGDQFVVEMANTTYLEIVDKNEASFVGRPLFDSLPEVQEIVEPLLKNVLSTGIAFHATEFPVWLNRHGKREFTYFNLVYHPLKNDDNGDIRGIIVVATEVTDLVIAKQSLVESEKHFRNMVTLSPIAMTILRGKDFIIEMANTVMFETIWRKKESETVGKSILTVFPELKAQKYPELLNRVLNNGEMHMENESIAYVHGNDGERKFYLDFQYAPLPAHDGSISGIMITVNDVTDKVLARKKVEESEKRFRVVADSAPALIWMSDIDKLCFFFNKAWLSFTGRTMEEEAGNGWAEGVHPDDFKRCLDIYQECFDKREEFYMEYRLKRHDGEYRWLSDNGTPRFTSDGEFEGFIGACMDIHERIVSQQILKENEEKLNIVIEASELGTWELDFKEQNLHYSDRFLEIFGYPERVELSHEQLVKHIHPDDLSLRKQAFQHAFINGVIHYKARVIWNDGAIHWVEAKGKLFYDEANQPATMIGTLLDITEEQHYQRELQDREQKFRLLADAMPQQVWTSDPEGNITYINGAVINYIGLLPEQVKTDGWIRFVHPADAARFTTAWLKSVNSGEDFIIEYRLHRIDGLYRWHLCRAIAQRNAVGNIQMWVGTSTDIQDQKTSADQLEKQVRERTAELEQKNRELETMNSELKSFAYVSSHDLQEPLRKIQTFASRIVDKEAQNLTGKGIDYFYRIQESAKRMQKLIEDLLAYSRTNITERIFEYTDITRIVEDVKTELQDDIKRIHAVVETHELCEARIIPFQFRQLIHNLLSNALKFSKPGKPPHIKITSHLVNENLPRIAELKPGKQYCHLSFSDDGIGFDPIYKDRIFEVFQRLHSQEQYKGTGIGLAIVKKIVENHNGVIEASGRLNEGATFDIYLPES